MNALTIVHETIKRVVRAGDVCIDATAGRGYDTAFLCELVGKDGKVVAMDIQQDAVVSTRALLQSKGLTAEVVLDSHANMAKYAQKESVRCIVFNLGYLPKGDHGIYTHFESTKQAIESGLELLEKGGLMCVSSITAATAVMKKKTRFCRGSKLLTTKSIRCLPLSSTTGRKIRRSLYS